MKIVKVSVEKEVKKYLQKTYDDYLIETGCYDIDEYIICISSQVGCAMGCVFCATSCSEEGSGFIRNLTSEEIILQVENVLKDVSSGKRILFSYMGMGEPFLNYENVVESAKVLRSKFPNSRVTFSTLGVYPDLMRKFACEDINGVLKLHLSLHAPDNILRKKILPSSGDIKEALRALDYFSEKRGVQSKINYVMIKGVNDSMDCAKKLGELLKDFSFVVKLSNLNSFKGMETSDLDKFDMFEKVLHSYGVETCRFFSIGTSIDAGCGQLKADVAKDHRDH